MAPLGSAGGRGGVEMPPFNVRNSIAVKVAAKKTAKGYVLSEEACAKCEMPLLMLNGKSECKTCPAIAKWVQRQKEAGLDSGGGVVNEARDAVDERMDEYEARDGAPADEALSIGKADSCDSEDSGAIRARALQIIRDARKQGGWDDDEEEESVKSSKEENVKEAPVKLADDLSVDSSVPSYHEAKASYSMDDDSTVGVSLDDRAADIIKRARENFVAELGPEARALLTPRVGDANVPQRSVKKSVDPSPRMQHVENVKVEECPQAEEEYSVESTESNVSTYDPQEEEVFGENIRSKVFVGTVESSASEKSFEERYEPLGVVDDHTGDEDEPEEQEEEVSYEEDPPSQEGKGVHHISSSICSSSEESRQAAASRKWQQQTQQHIQMRHSVQASSSDATVPSRGIFADMACKFDDAVTNAMGKVTKMMSCEMDAPGGFPEGFIDAFEAEQNRYDAASQAYAQVSKAKYEAQIMLLNLRGWRISNGACDRCDKAWMVNPEDGTMLCAACDDVESLPFPTAAPVAVSPTAEELAPVQQPIAHTPAAMPNLHDLEMERRLQMGWVATNAGCPHCFSKLVRKRGEEMDHCVSCGPIFTPQNQAMTPSMPALTAYTPQSAHPSIAATPNPNPVQAIAAKRSDDISLDPRRECAASPTTSMEQNEDIQMQTAPVLPEADAKENAPEAPANVNDQLDEAKRRIEEAKKFILSRKKSSGIAPQQSLATREPTGQTLSPFTNITQEANVLGPTPNVKALSLLSPKTAQSNTTPGTGRTLGTKGSGYATPQMPGRYFFA
ncbi:hypothetical protein ACHAXT_010255 [Thalassiosira profunda]